MRAQAFMVRSSRITSTAGYSACICCTYSRPTGYSFPSLRRSISAPILPRARHTHGLDSDSGFWILDSDWIGFRPQLAAARRNLQRCFELRAILVFGFGFWIRIRIGLDYGRICHPSAIICHHLLSSAVRRRKPALLPRILRCSSHFGKQKYGSPTPRRAGSRPGLSRNPWELYNQNGTNQQMVYGTLKHDFSP